MAILPHSRCSLTAAERMTAPADEKQTRSASGAARSRGRRTPAATAGGAVVPVRECVEDGAHRGNAFADRGERFGAAQQHAIRHELGSHTVREPHARSPTSVVDLLDGLERVESGIGESFDELPLLDRGTSTSPISRTSSGDRMSFGSATWANWSTATCSATSWSTRPRRRCRRRARQRDATLPTPGRSGNQIRTTRRAQSGATEAFASCMPPAYDDFPRNTAFTKPSKPRGSARDDPSLLGGQRSTNGSDTRRHLRSRSCRSPDHKRAPQREGLHLDRTLLVVAGDPWQKGGLVVARPPIVSTVCRQRWEPVAGLEASRIEDWNVKPPTRWKRSTFAGA